MSTSSALTATFSEAIDSNTVTAATFTLKDSATNPVTGNITTSGVTVMFALGTPLNFGTTYTATLTSGIKDLAGNALAAPFSWSFTTGVATDLTPPTVSNTNPANGATNVSTSSALTATFSEPVNPATVTAATFTLKDSANNPVTGNITTSGVTVTFALPPGTPLNFGTAYTATLTTGIKDLAGNALASPRIWSFTTDTGGTTSSTGLDFPGSAVVPNGQTMRLKFDHPELNGLPIYGSGGAGVTYIWRAYPRQQAGYYTAFFWGNDDGGGDLRTLFWKNGSMDSYYGPHPYPDNPPGGNTHKWEIAVQGDDYVNGTVVYDRWYTQALRVWADPDGTKHHEFYWDLPNTDESHRVTHDSPNTWGNATPPAPSLTWGDAPWNHGDEVWKGILRGVQIYASKLSLPEIQSEITTPRSTAAGTTNIWYLNLNPTPTDISDKSGKGHHPSWVGNLRPTLFTE